MIRVGIMGATGYMGGEALRVLLDHPEVEIAWLTSRTEERIDEHHPNLYGLGLRARPAGASDALRRRVPRAPDGGRDRGGRAARSPRARRSSISAPRFVSRIAQPGSASTARLTRRGRSRPKRSTASPSCTRPTSRERVSSRIPAASRLRRSSVSRRWSKSGSSTLDRLVVDGLSGTAGAGAELHRAAHHPEIGNNLVPYNVVGHRHTFEMEQELGALAGAAGAACTSRRPTCRSCAASSTSVTRSRRSRMTRADAARALP